MADTPHAWIYYRDSGGQGTPLLMLHGNAETHLVFDYYEKKLSEKYRTILMDSRAHGRSELKPECAKKEFASLFPERTTAVIAVSGNISPDGLILPLRLFSTGKYYFLKVVNGFFKQHLFRQQQLASFLCNSPMMTEEQLQEIKAPVLLIAGTHDVVKVSHSRRMAHLIPHAQLVLMKGDTHTAMFVRKQQYLEIMESFLEMVNGIVCK